MLKKRNSKLRYMVEKPFKSIWFVLKQNPKIGASRTQTLPQFMPVHTLFTLLCDTDLAQFLISKIYP